MRGGLTLLVGLALCVGCEARNTRNDSAKATVTATAATAASKGAAQAVPDEDSAPAPVVFTPGTARRHRYAFTSMVGDTHFVAIDKLPRVDCRAVRGSDCGNPNMTLDNPKTPAARRARSLGWIVTSEERLGLLTAVGISRGYLFLPGNLNKQFDGNVAIFEGDTPIAILHRNDEDGYGIGRLERLESGALRVAPPYPLAPRGDLSLKGRHLFYRPMHSSDYYCGGRALVPNIYGAAIGRARAMLFAGGWRPAKVRHWGLDPDLRRFAQAHIPEGEGCATDSAGQCTFRYASPVARLEVETGFDPITVETERGGDWLTGNKVIWYGLTCRVPRSGAPGRR